MGRILMYKLFENFKEASYFAKTQAILKKTMFAVRRQDHEWIVSSKNAPNNYRIKKKFNRYNAFNRYMDYEIPVDPKQARLERLSVTRKTGEESTWRNPKRVISGKKIQTMSKNYNLCRSCTGNGCIRCQNTGWSS